jgi:hypothetical protein
MLSAHDRGVGGRHTDQTVRNYEFGSNLHRDRPPRTMHVIYT